MVCTICKFIPGNEEYIFSHNAFGCPFMKTNICTNCFQYGHTPKYCQNQKVFTSPPLLTDVKRYYSGEAAEDEMLKRLVQHEKVCERLSILNGGYTGACTFCRNSKQYNPCNRWMNNHSLSKCPRLALVVCRYCGNKGHTDRKCPKKQEKESRMCDEMMDGTDGMGTDGVDEELIVDFDIYGSGGGEVGEGGEGGGEVEMSEQSGEIDLADELGFNMMSMKI